MRRLKWIAGALLLAVIVAATVLFVRYVPYRTGELVPIESIARPETVALLSYTAREGDPGVIAALARIRELDARKKHSRLPVWARALIAGSTEEGVSAQAAAMLPVRLVAYLDRDEDGETAGAVIVSLSRWSGGLKRAIGVDPARRHRGVPYAPPVSKGEPFGALVSNNMVFAAREIDLFRTIDRLNGDGDENSKAGGPGKRYGRIVEAVPSREEGVGLILNPSDALETMAHSLLDLHKLSLGSRDRRLRLTPRKLIGAGFSIDLIDADRARLDGRMLFGNPDAARSARRWAEHELPRALALLGLESRFELTAEGAALRFETTIDGLDALWDRMLAGRLL